MARTFMLLWRTDHGFTIRDMNENRLVFVFEDEADRERVMMGEPWAYDKYLIILQRIEEEEAIEDVVFRETSLWVQLHGLPIRKMNLEVANTLVSSLGRVEQISNGDTNADGGQAMRIRVRLDVTKPLCRGRKARLEKGHETWIFFKYERLPNFCYWCGLLSNSDKDCPQWLLNKEELRAEDQQFGPWNEETKRDLLRSHIGGGCRAALPSAMNCLAWNCHGLGNPRTVQEIARLVRAQDPSVVFLIETWQDDGPLERLRCQLQFANKFVVKSRNKGGGLCLLWKNEVKLRVQSFSHSHIDAFVSENQPDAWHLTGFYGAPGDPPAVEEKQGRFSRSENQMQRFRDALDDCDFIDLGYSGPSYTWTNNRVGDMTWERLDRAVATSDWLMLFPTAKVHHLEGHWSNHKPILAVSKQLRPIGRQRKLEFPCTKCGIKFMHAENGFGCGAATALSYTEKKKEPYSPGERPSWFMDSTPIPGIPRVVTPDINQHLIRDFVPLEVQEAVKQMSPTKALGPDGLPPMFYQKYWHLIGEDISNAVLTCLNTGKILKAINHTHITLIPKIVSESQSAFVPGRLITDNILVAFETLHHMHQQRKGKYGSVALKLDMSKAYDRVEWKFLEKVMQQMGFHHKWRVCHSLLQRAKNAGDIHGVSISRSGPKLTHLFFADDSLLFYKATTNEIRCIQDILTEYEHASGQQINCQKTTLFFSNSTPRHIKDSIQAMLGIKERVWSKLKGWKEKLISQAGREILIKSVAQAIPAYAMSCFRLPNRLIKEIEVLIRRFWWGQGGERDKMHWLSWDSFCRAKNSGGLGFRELDSFNEALLAKQVWRLMHNKTSLFYKVFKAKYFPHCSVLDAQLNARGSFAWKSIMGARELISLIRIPERGILAVVKANFLSFEAEIILGIPLCNTRNDDMLIWGGTKTGHYAVRSGYHMLLGRQAEGSTGNLKCSTPNSGDASYIDFMDLYYRNMQILQTQELQIFAMLTWLIWFHCNRQRLDQPTDEIDRLYPRALELLTEFHQAQDNHSQTSHATEPSTRTKWKLPIPDRFKVNFDGATFAETNEAGLGAIIRNHQGEVMASLCQ
uniref:Reverse transcriptase domain-containing protein n=1 Tax=Fagus sylvatica TaxID=28930 RepID=A0A2N9I833_FAGSY